VHQDDQRLRVLVFHDQGLDHGVFGDVEFARRHLGAAVFLVLVEVVGMGDAVLVQELGRRGFGARFRVAGVVSHTGDFTPVAA
jgi:hypothetical protein